MGCQRVGLLWIIDILTFSKTYEFNKRYPWNRFRHVQTETEGRESNWNGITSHHSIFWATQLQLRDDNFSALQGKAFWQLRMAFYATKPIFHLIPPVSPAVEMCQGDIASWITMFVFCRNPKGIWIKLEFWVHEHLRCEKCILVHESWKMLWATSWTMQW